MKKNIYLHVLFICLTAFGFTNAQEYTLTIKFSGTTSNKGKLMYTIFDKANGFPKKVEMAFEKGIVYLTNNQAELKLRLPKGEFAVMAFHDEDDNNELKTNWIGIPKEGIGNSNNHRGFPNYKKSVFDLREDKTIEIQMIYM